MVSKSSRAALVVGAIGVVFGDIGTSPLYALKEIFNGHHPIPVDADHVLGILSLIFWAVMLLVSIKYVTIIMRADNRGEGGSLALLALIIDRAANQRLTWLVTMLGIFAAALFFGDSMITPAISVMAAMEGLEVITPTLKPWVIPMTAIILTLLFAIQRQGTGVVGLAFGPMMIGWFALLAILGIQQIAENPSVLRAVSPAYAVAFIREYTGMAFLALGSVVLTVTGGEALYTDMGHFGRSPIRIAWFGFVVPALMLNYFGQGALLLAEPEAIRSPFFHLGPSWALIPLVVMATIATVIASQAVISGAFSVARQSVQMGLLPRMKIVHTSGHTEGQIYVPFTNWTLYLAVMALVIGFGSSSNLAAAYGIAVTGTMMIDTVLLACVMVLLWNWRWLTVAPVIGVLLLSDLAFFGANIIKIPYGGWFPIVMGIAAFTVLTTWRRGRQLVSEEIARHDIPLDFFIGAVSGEVQRVPGTAIFMTSSLDGVPAALLHNIKHNKILHERIVLVTVRTTDTPTVGEDQRLAFSDLGSGFHRLVISYGFMEDPDVPKALSACAPFGHHFEELDTSYFLSRESIVPNLRQGLPALRARLFSLMSRNALSATEYFRIPSNRVVELGTQLQI